jgi:hypothetical protein
MSVDANLANENRVTSVVTAYITGRQSLDWALSEIQGIKMDSKRLHQLVHTTIHRLGSLDVLRDTPVTSRGNELLTRLGLH